MLIEGGDTHIEDGTFHKGYQSTTYNLDMYR